jgi:hypothetical protein
MTELIKTIKRDDLPDIAAITENRWQYTGDDDDMGVGVVHTFTQTKMRISRFVLEDENVINDGINALDVAVIRCLPQKP